MNNPTNSPTAEADTENTKRRGRVKDMAIYPLSEIAAGTYEAYFTTYISLLMTTVYRFSVTLAGVLESLQSIVGWVVQPLFGIFLDRFSFKKSKYWPWYIILGIGCGVAYIVIFSIPVLSSNPASLAIPVACVIAIAAIFLAGADQVGLNIYASQARGSKERAYIGSAAKFGRDGMKVVFGLSFPLMLVAFTSAFGGEIKAWALAALIFAGIAIIVYIILAVITSKSQAEKEAQAKGNTRTKATVKQTLLSIFTNRALLVAVAATILSKTFFFFHILGGSYFWKFYMGNFTMMSAFSTSFSLCAIIGALCVPVFLKLLKDTKRTYVVAFCIQAVVYLCAMLLVSPTDAVRTIAVLSCASFFNGVTDSLTLPLFAGATDYAKWKYGTAEVGLTMSCFALAVRVGLVVSIAVRTVLLAAGGFDSKALAAGAAVPGGVMTALFNMNTIIPAVICVVIALVVSLLYPANDRKLAEMRRDLKAREASAQ